MSDLVRNFVEEGAVPASNGGFGIWARMLVTKITRDEGGWTAAVVDAEGFEVAPPVLAFYVPMTLMRIVLAIPVKLRGQSFEWRAEARLMNGDRFDLDFYFRVSMDSSEVEVGARANQPMPLVEFQLTVFGTPFYLSGAQIDLEEF